MNGLEGVALRDKFEPESLFIIADLRREGAVLWVSAPFQ
jgi:hypothetical protein